MSTTRALAFDTGSGYLPTGFHTISHKAFRELCVDFVIYGPYDWDYPKRDVLFAGYERLIAALTITDIDTEQWIGGSYVSTLYFPNDIDLVNFCDVIAYEQLSPEVRAMLAPFFKGEHTAKHCHCDSYFAPLPPEEHRNDEDFLIIRRYWEGKLGKDRAGIEKGIIRRTLPDPEETNSESQTNAATA